MHYNNIKETLKLSVGIGEVIIYFGVKVNKSGFIHSPFTTDRTPSCKINFEKQTYRCYATKNSGDIFSLWQAYRGCDFKTAVLEMRNTFLSNYDYNYSSFKLIAQPIPLQADKSDVLEDMSEDEKAFYKERLEQSDNNKNLALEEVRTKRIEDNCKIFSELITFCKNDPDARAIEYLKSRGLNEETQNKWNLVSIKDPNRLSTHLKAAFPIKDLQRSGLFNEKENLLFPYHRIIIPYLVSGKAVYLRGRYWNGATSIPGDSSKYIGLKNDSLNVNSSRRFFNSDVFETALLDSEIYITEGEFDTIVNSELLDKNSLAIPGVSNIPKSIKHPGKYDKTSFSKFQGFIPIIQVDQDEAGKQLTSDLVDIFDDLGIECEIERIPAKDITEWVMQNG